MLFYLHYLDLSIRKIINFAGTFERGVLLLTERD